VLIASASEESKQHSEIAQKGEASAAGGGMIIAGGFAIGFIYNVIMKVFSGWREYPTKEFDEPFRGGSVSLENNPALLGVGYIIGPRIAGIMFAGGAMAYWVLIPMIRYFGDLLTEPLAPATTLIRDMPIEGAASIQSEYILYIGAGAVTAGGIISLFRSLPTIWHGLRGGISDYRTRRSNAAKDDGDLKAAAPNRTRHSTEVGDDRDTCIDRRHYVFAGAEDEHFGRGADHRSRIFVRNGFVAADG
jgi:uncharacterized oligopeptide transporter (OPT) family protein